MALYQNKLFMRHYLEQRNVPMARAWICFVEDVQNAEQLQKLLADITAHVLPQENVLLKHPYAASSRGMLQCSAAAPELTKCLKVMFFKSFCRKLSGNF